MRITQCAKCHETLIAGAGSISVVMPDATREFAANGIPDLMMPLVQVALCNACTDDLRAWLGIPDPLKLPTGEPQ